MVATHEAAMECFRRAALAEQTFAGRELGLKYGDRLVRSFAALTEPSTGTAARASRWSGSSTSPFRPVARPSSAPSPRGEGATSKVRIEPMHLPMHQSPQMRGADPNRERLPVAGGVG